MALAQQTKFKILYSIAKKKKKTYMAIEIDKDASYKIRIFIYLRYGNKNSFESLKEFEFIISILSRKQILQLNQGLNSHW